MGHGSGDRWRPATGPVPSDVVTLTDGLILRRAVPADLTATARTHVRFLPVGLFPSMGARYLRRWHRTYLRLPAGLALVVVDPASEGEADGGVVAFLLGTTDQEGHSAALLADRRLLVELSVSGLFALLRRPRVAVHFLRTRGRPWLRKLARTRGAPSGSAVRTGDKVAVLAAVAVDTGARGRGLGAHLVRHFVAEARNSGADVAELVTVAPADGGATSGFYERLGWRAAGDRRTRDGTTVRTFALPLRDHAQPTIRSTRRPGEKA